MKKIQVLITATILLSSIRAAPAPGAVQMKAFYEKKAAQKSKNNVLEKQPATRILSSPLIPFKVISNVRPSQSNHFSDVRTIRVRTSTKKAISEPLRSQDGVISSSSSSSHIHSFILPGAVPDTLNSHEYLSRKSKSSSKSPMSAQKIISERSENVVQNGRITRMIGGRAARKSKESIIAAQGNDGLLRSRHDRIMHQTQKRKDFLSECVRSPEKMASTLVRLSRIQPDYGEYSSLDRYRHKMRNPIGLSRFKKEADGLNRATSSKLSIDEDLAITNSDSESLSPQKNLDHPQMPSISRKQSKPKKMERSERPSFRRRKRKSRKH